jgi:SAM-dependent methyltransferase
MSAAPHAFGCTFPVVDGIPVFLLPEKEQTIGIASASLEAAQSGTGSPLYLKTLGLADQERARIEREWNNNPENSIDPVISYIVGATSGWGYLNVMGRLPGYPIPKIPIEQGRGRRLLDVGCNWGRWSVSAAQKGWKVIGVDPSLGALLAARRAFNELGLDMNFVCADARFLPFAASSFDAAFSYSVLQHFSEDDAETALGEIGRVLRSGAFAKIQMAHSGGLRSTYHRTRPSYKHAGVFRVRYWPLRKMREVFTRQIGPASVRAEAFGGLGLLREDWPYVTVKARFLIVVSQIFKRLASIFPPVVSFADSVYVTAYST